MLTAELQSIFDHTWTTLLQAVSQFDHPLRTATLVTGGDQPSGRTVIIRAVEPATRRISIHTDIRSPKMNALSQDDRVQLVFYHPALREQWLLRGDHRVYREEASVRAIWDKTPLKSRLNYMTQLPPGTPIPQPEAAWPAGLREHPTLPACEPAYRNFAVLVATIDEVDCLQLSDTGSRRGLFHWNGDWTGHWATP